MLVCAGGIKGVLDVQEKDTLADVRIQIDEELDDDLIVPDFAFHVNNVRISQKQERKKSAWLVLDKIVSLQAKRSRPLDMDDATIGMPPSAKKLKVDYSCDNATMQITPQSSLRLHGRDAKNDQSEISGDSDSVKRNPDSNTLSEADTTMQSNSPKRLKDLFDQAMSDARRKLQNFSEKDPGGDAGDADDIIESASPSEGRIDPTPESESNETDSTSECTDKADSAIEGKKTDQDDTNETILNPQTDDAQWNPLTGSKQVENEEESEAKPGNNAVAVEKGEPSLFGSGVAKPVSGPSSVPFGETAEPASAPFGCSAFGSPSALGSSSTPFGSIANNAPFGGTSPGTPPATATPVVDMDIDFGGGDDGDDDESDAGTVDLIDDTNEDCDSTLPSAVTLPTKPNARSMDAGNPNDESDSAVETSRSVLTSIKSMLEENPEFCSIDRRKEWTNEIEGILAKSSPKTTVGVLGNTGVGKVSVD